MELAAAEPACLSALTRTCPCPPRNDSGKLSLGFPASGATCASPKSLVTALLWSEALCKQLVTHRHTALCLTPVLLLSGTARNKQLVLGPLQKEMFSSCLPGKMLFVLSLAVLLAGKIFLDTTNNYLNRAVLEK